MGIQEKVFAACRGEISTSELIRAYWELVKDVGPKRAGEMFDDAFDEYERTKEASTHGTE